MIITESGAFRKGLNANLLSPFRDSDILSAPRPKLKTNPVEAFSRQFTHTLEIASRPMRNELLEALGYDGQGRRFRQNQTGATLRRGRAEAD